MNRQSPPAGRSPHALSIDTLFAQSVERAPDDDAVVDRTSGRRWTYAELDGAVDAVARGLQDRGVGPGDRVAICLRNRPEHAVAFLATQRIGAVAAPFNFRHSTEGVRFAVEDCDPALFVYGPAVADAVAEIADALPVERFVVVAPPAGGPGAEAEAAGEPVDPDAHSFAEAFDELLRTGGDPDPVDVALDDPSLIQYSSGTTGDPKGIVLDHLATATRVYVDAFGNRYRMGERMLGVMPLYHTVGLHGILLTTLALGGRYVSMPHFDPAACVRAIEAEGVTALHEAPTIYRRLVDAAATTGADVASVRVVSYSGAPMGSALVDRVRDAFAPDYISNQYGCTEMYAPLSQVDLDEADPVETGTAHLFYRSRLVSIGEGDPTALVDPGEEGELIFGMESPVAFGGYWRRPAAEREAIHDGWFFTGDVAYQPRPGRTIITGRADDMIISGGENIYPAEIEDVLAGHPAVGDVAVVGVDDAEWGQRVVAYVETREAVSADDLDRWCRDSATLADFKRPRAYEFVESIPRNPSGKVQRFRLRDDA